MKACQELDFPYHDARLQDVTLGLAVDYAKRMEPEHKVERNLLRNSDNLFQSHDSLKSRSLEHHDSSKSLQ